MNMLLQQIMMTVGSQSELAGNSESINLSRAEEEIRYDSENIS